MAHVASAYKYGVIISNRWLTMENESREQAKNIAKYAQAFSDGKDVEYYDESLAEWILITNPIAWHTKIRYRIKEYPILTHESILQKWFKRKNARCWVKVEAFAELDTNNQPNRIYFLKYQSAKDIIPIDPSTGFTAEELSRDFEWK